MRLIKYTIILALVFVSKIHADTCTIACDALYVVDPDPVDICGTDGEDHRAPLAAIGGLPKPYGCYRMCGVSVRYPGKCACPNSCNSRTGKGNCTSTGCVCQAGWGGVDCSAVACPNACSNQGTCSFSNQTGADMCVCNNGFTGLDCSAPTPPIPSLPFGQVLPGTYYYNDKYGDDHPVFNISVLGNFNLQMNSDDYNNMLLPANTWNQSYVKANGTFSNGNIFAALTNIDIKIKGKWSRIANKKTFRIKFDKTPSSPSFFGLSQIALKASTPDPSYIHNQVIVELYRAMAVPVTRGSFGTLTINGIFMGLFWFNEEIDQVFALSRYGTDKGNMYSMYNYLVYLGDDPNSYENVTQEEDGGIVNKYDLEFGDKRAFSDLAIQAKLENSSSEEQFASEIRSILNVDNFVRSMVVETTYDDPDGWIMSGDNWALYNCSVNNTWQYLSHDFEYSMWDPYHDAWQQASQNKNATLAYKVFNISQNHDLFNAYYQIFLEKVFDPSLPNSSKSRVKAIAPILKSTIMSDEWYRIDDIVPVPFDESTWAEWIDQAQLFLDLRYANLKKQFS